ncbi:hypothetical protein [Paracoccus sp. S3-43]|uniref:hypothetical protein n=1 Tax=Paracoccus sp. S3-43 TaxID=3030011 RepID=UPI0023B0F420|nr:hypothetical protein [Paracoccus sp. S3-43]WEF23649.1 hypothetical protein PXD02_12670 [Paracoccus sp. S3-43]
MPDLCAATLAEIICAASLDGAAAGFALAALPEGALFWAQDRLSGREAGAPFLPGIGRRLLRADLSRPADVLAAMEDALSCPSLAAVVGEIWGDPAALDFTATRRLAMRAEAAGRPCWLLRRAASADASAARMRWRVAACPSVPSADDPAAPGDPCWRVGLFRSRLSPPGEWLVRHERGRDGAPDRLHFSALAADRALAEPPAETGRSGAE